jgi:tetratricopeptide (TPR) repeat protein
MLGARGGYAQDVYMAGTVSEPSGVQGKLDRLFTEQTEQKLRSVRLEAGAGALEKSVDGLKDTFRTAFEWCFGAFTVMFGLSTLIQALQNRREFALLREQGKRNEEIVNHQDKITNELQEANRKSIEQVTKFVGSLDAVFAIAQRQDETTKGLQEASRNSIEQVTKFVGSLDAVFAIAHRQDETTKELQDASRKSIEQVTQFIGSLDSLFKLSHKVNEFEGIITSMNDREAKRQQTEAAQRRNEARELNRMAVEICFTLDRENYKAGYHQQRIRSLSEKLAALPDKSQLSSNSRRILGLDYVVRGMFKEALAELEFAAQMAKAHAADSSSVDIDLFYPGIDPSKVQGSASREANISLFHRAIACYNLGDHVAAMAQFREALKYKEQDVQSMVYIPEARFLSRQHEFGDIIQAFEKTETDILGIVDTRDWRVPREAHLSLLRVKLGNCYFPGCRHEPYRKQENLRLAEMHYLKAWEYDQQVPPGAPGSGSYLAKFSYGHALSIKAKRKVTDAERRDARALSRKLLSEVLETVRIKVGEVTEPKIQMTLYYILAICGRELENTQDAKRYVLEIYERGGKLPPIDGFRVFSPLTKNDLVYAELKRELREFEAQLSSASHDAAVSLA